MSGRLRLHFALAALPEGGPCTVCVFCSDCRAQCACHLSRMLHVSVLPIPRLRRAAVFLLDGDKRCFCRSPVLWFRLWLVCNLAGIDVRVWHILLRVVGQRGEYCPVLRPGAPLCGWCPIGVMGVQAQAVRWWAWVSRRCCAMGSCHVNECRSATVVHPLTVVGRTGQCPRSTFYRSGCLVSSVQCVGPVVCALQLCCLFTGQGCCSGWG
jgi:hypothetical protein